MSLSKNVRRCLGLESTPLHIVYARFLM